MSTPTNQQAELPDAVKVKYLESAVMVLAAEVAAGRMFSDTKERKSAILSMAKPGTNDYTYTMRQHTDAHPLASRAVAAALADVAEETPKPEIKLAE